MFDSLMLAFFGFGKKWFGLCFNIYKSIFKGIANRVSENKEISAARKQALAENNTVNGAYPTDSDLL